MAEPHGPGEWTFTTDDEGRSGRATVALVDAKVDGLKDLLRAEFASVRDNIKPLAGVVLEVASLRKDVDDLDNRVDGLEKGKQGDRDYRRIHLPSLVIAGIMAISSIIINVLHYFT